jgi:hypothetical protein
MKATRLILRIYGEKSDGQWSLICLDFSLAAQADTIEEAKAILRSQIREYLMDAVMGQDREYAFQLLSRRAPLKYWLKWWYGLAVRCIVGHADKQHKAYRQAMPLVPA